MIIFSFKKLDNNQKIIYLCSVIKKSNIIKCLKKSTVNEKEKLKIKLATIDNALNLERRRSKMLGLNVEERIDKLLDLRNQVKRKIEKLENK